MRTSHSQAMDPLSEIVFGQECVRCGDQDGPLCQGCCALLKSNPPTCPFCSRLSTLGIVCQFHRGQAVTAGLSLAPYTDNFHPVLWAAKFKRNRALAELLAHSLAQAVERTGWEVELVTFVPSHWLNRIRRGYILSELCARTVASRLQLPLVNTLVSRTIASQVGLGRRSRLENPIHRFGRRSHVPSRVVLVDDIRTTGATLTRCAALLREGGARRVYTATIFAENMR